MRRVLFFFMLCSAAVQADSLRVVIAGFSSMGAYWEPSRKDASRAPVMVWLHGGMGSRDCAKGLRAGTALLDPQLGVDAWVVSPSACGENHWLRSGTALIDALLDSLEQREKIQVDSIRMVGVSDGGLGVLAYSVQGRRKVVRRLLVSSNPGLVADPRYMAGQPRAREGAWMFLQGGADRLYPESRTRPWMQEFCSLMGSMQCLLRYDSQGQHDWSWWLTHRPDWIRYALRY